jgi:L,D-peptidoglycan transpeptidase YkuD (ErfK/YbiS/YcfS/YnhG family)
LLGFTAYCSQTPCAPPRSSHYNHIVPTTDTELDWQSAERMRRDDDLCVLAIVVEHDTKGPKPRAGSYIFIHLWEGPDKGMSGCRRCQWMLWKSS